MNEREKNFTLVEVNGEYIEASLAIAQAQTFEELFEVLDKLGDVRGSSQNFTPEMIKRIIGRYRLGQEDEMGVTRTFGLREAVVRLRAAEIAANEVGKMMPESAAVLPTEPEATDSAELPVSELVPESGELSFIGSSEKERVLQLRSEIISIKQAAKEAGFDLKADPSYLKIDPIIERLMKIDQSIRSLEPSENEWRPLAELDPNARKVMQSKLNTLFFSGLVEAETLVAEVKSKIHGEEHLEAEPQAEHQTAVAVEEITTTLEAESVEATKSHGGGYWQNPEWQEATANWRQAKENWRTTKERFENRRSEYYEYLAKRGAFERMFNRVPNNLPPEFADLTQLYIEYGAAEKEYAAANEKRVALRAQSRAVPSMTEPAVSSVETGSDQEAPSKSLEAILRSGIYQRFIQKPGDAELALQREALGFWSTETRESARQLAETLRKYRALRIGLTGAAVGIGVGVLAPAGAAAAGLWAGGSYITRAIGGIVGSSAGAALGEAMRGYVESGYHHAFTEKRRKALEDFEKEAIVTASADKLGQQKMAYEGTKRAFEKSEKRKKTLGRSVVIGSAVIGGGVGNVMAGESLDTAAEASSRSPRILGEEWFRPGAPLVSPDEPELPPEPSGFESIRLPNQVAVTHYDHNGDLYGRSIVRNIELVGPQLAETPLSQQRELLEGLLSEKINDLLDDRPHMSRQELGAALQAKLAERFGGESWWVQHPIQEIRIGEINFVDYGPDGFPRVSAPTSPPEDLHTPEATVTPEPAAEVVHTVRSGDTLWGILKQRYAAELEGLSRQEQNRVLDAVFDTARADAALRDSIGLRSGDIDLIYPREQLNVAGLGTELQRQVELLRSPSLVQELPERSVEAPSEPESLVVPLRTEGALTIDADTAEKNVAIKVPLREPEVMIEAVSTTPAEISQREVGALKAPEVTTQEKVTPPPTVYSATGNQFETPAYKAYVNEKFGSLKQFERVLASMVESVEKPTWGFFDSFFGDTPKSPLTKIGGMTLAEVEALYDRSYDAIVAELGEDIRYETFRQWMQKLPEMKQVVEHKPTTRFDDLLARYVAETHLKAR